MRQIACVTALGVMGSLVAATVTLDPGNGVETNVTARFTGATDLVINSGATGGGIVTLANPLSTYTGKTTVNSGTLVVPDGDVAKDRSAIGASGPIVLGPGTLRASGTLGAVVTNTYANNSTAATVLDVQDELHVTNDFVQKAGCFIKTGPGTVYFSGARNYFGGELRVTKKAFAETTAKLALNANGDAPTAGRRGAFILAEGKVVIEGGYNVFGNTNCCNSIGTWTVDEGTEKSAILEIRGGTNVFERCVYPGYMNGFAGTTGGAAVRSGLRITGGVVTNGPTANDTVFVGGATAVSGKTFDTNPFIEVTGGMMYTGKNFQLGNMQGVNTTLDISGTGKVIVNSYVGAGYTQGYNTNTITVSEGGSLKTTYISTKRDKSSKNVRLDVRILDGGTITCTGPVAFQRDGAIKTHEMNVLLDGGIFSNGSGGSGVSTNFPSALASLRVGTRGFTFSGVTNTKQHQKDNFIQKSIVYTNTHPGEARQPIDFKAVNDSRRTYYVLDKNCTIDAPVRVWASSYLWLMQGADVVGGNSISLGNASRLGLREGVHTVDTLSFGFDGNTSGYCNLMVETNSTLVVTREVLHPGDSTVNVYLRGENWNVVTVQPGVYTLIAAPAASRDVLASLSFTYSNSGDGKVSAHRFQVVEENGQAKLQLVVMANSVSTLAQGVWSNGSGDGLWKTGGNWEGGAAVDAADAEAVFSKDAAAGGETVTLAGQAAAGGIAFSGANGYTVTGGELLLGDNAAISSVAPTTNVIASALTATTQVNVNSARTGGGVVKLTGDLSGLAGGLSVNSGTLEVNDLSFVTDASKLVLGSGTFAYAGAGAGTLEGITLGVNAQRGAVLRVDSPLTLKSAVRTADSMFVKTGAETLTLKGTGTFEFGNNYVWTCGDGRFVGDSGDGPTECMYGFTVREGRLVIGTVDDPTDAPTVTAYSLAAGGQPLEGRAPAEIVMNNGTVTLPGGSLKVDGYLGGTATNSLTVNGGSISVGGALSVGLAIRGADDVLAPAVVTVNGGSVESRAEAVTLFANNNEMELFLNAGGALKSVGLAGGSSSALGGVAHFNGGSYKPFNCGNNVIYLRYLRHAYLGAGGLVIDTFGQGERNTEPCYLHVNQVFEKDPELGEAAAGGIVVRGDGVVYLNPAFSMAGCDGGITVEDGATLIANKGAVGRGCTVRVKAGATFRTYQNEANTTIADSLVLGEAGATKPARFEVGSTNGKGISNCIVSNDFTVAGPVLFATRSVWSATALANTTGVYTMFVYRAACDANVDEARFALDPGMSSLTADFAKADVTLGGETGWRALVATVRAAAPGELPRWTATSSGGNWSEAANWSNGLSPNGKNAVARFASAGAADVPVTLDAAATVGQALFEATTAGKGYALGGANALTFARDDGEALLDVASGGKVTVNAPVASDGLVCVNAAQGEANRGTAGEVVFGAGALDGFAGTLYLRSGRTTIPSLAWMKDASQLRLGYGTVVYTGTGETIPGFQVSPTSFYMSALEIENDLTVTGGTAMVANNGGAFLKGGAGTLHLKGEGNFSLGNNHNQTYNWDGRSQNTRLANGDSVTNTTVNLSVGGGRLVIGEAGDATAGPTVYTSAYAAIGVPAGGESDAELEINSGSFTVQKHDLYVGFYHGYNEAVKAKLTVNGGMVNVNEEFHMPYGTATTCSPEVEMNGGELNVGQSLYMSEGRATRQAAVDSNATSTFTLNGGVVTVQTNFFVVYRNNAGERANHGRLYLNGGLLDVKGTLNVKRASPTTAEAWLNPGGTLKAGDLTATGTDGKFYFNGGLFLPYGEANGAATSLAASSLDLLVTTNGAVIGTANAKGAQYTVSAALKHDPALAGKDGGLVKTGAGLLVLSGANTYTGPTVVDQGTLAVLSGAPFTDDTVVRAGAFLDLNGADRTLGNLAGDGTVCNGSVTLAGALTPQDGIPTVDGDFATAPTACVDFGCTDGDMVALGSKHLVLRVTGTVDAGVKFKAINCGQPCSLTASVENGLVYVHVKSGGTVLLFR